MDLGNKINMNVIVIYINFGKTPLVTTMYLFYIIFCNLYLNCIVILNIKAYDRHFPNKTNTKIFEQFRIINLSRY